MKGYIISTEWNFQVEGIVLGLHVHSGPKEPQCDTPNPEPFVRVRDYETNDNNDTHYVGKHRLGP